MSPMLNRTLARALGLLALIASVEAAAGAPAPGSYVAFVTCPLLRDTPELPCWMARDRGTLYYLGIQSGRAFATKFFPPQMKHKVLVEGVVSSGPGICGGLPLEKLQASPLPELSAECDTMLPTKGFVSPKGRPAGADPAQPSGRNAPLRGPQDEPPVLYTEADVAARRPMRFDVLYTFDSDFTQYPLQQYKVVQAQAYAKAIEARRIQVTAYRGATLLSNGQMLVEQPEVPAKRAGNIRAILDAFDLPPALVSIEVRTTPEPARGEGDHLARRVQIDVVP